MTEEIEKFLEKFDSEDYTNYNEALKNDKKIIDELKIKISIANSRFSKFKIAVSNALLNPVSMYRYIKYRFLGSNLPLRFARKWIHRINIGAKY